RHTNRGRAAVRAFDEARVSAVLSCIASRRFIRAPSVCDEMSLEGAAVSLGATIVSVAFAALVFNQWIARRKPYQLAWSFGLGLYGAAAFLQFLAEAYGWSVATYKVYYLIAALLVAVLGIGSTFLLHRRAGVGFALYTVVVFIGFAIAVAGAAVNMSALAATVPAAGTPIADPNVRAFSYLFTVPGAAALVGIAGYSFGARG